MNLLIEMGRMSLAQIAESMTNGEMQAGDQARTLKAYDRQARQTPSTFDAVSPFHV